MDNPYSSLRIGISACLLYPDPSRLAFAKKTLVYVERSMLQWVMEGGATAWMMPPVCAGISAEDLVKHVDGLILHGGVDVSPTHYGEEPLQPAWAGDVQRDALELGLLHACMKMNKPVLGVCRGHQLINVAMGGSLYQDVVLQEASYKVHRDAEVYDGLHHEVDVLSSGKWLQEVYPGVERAYVNSVHHQAIKKLGKGLQVQAVCAEDGVVESVCLPGFNDVALPYVAGVQWHPEFKADAGGQKVLSSDTLLMHFLHACQTRKKKD